MADVVKIEKPLTSHFVSATYEVYTANDEQALEEVKELLELNKKNSKRQNYYQCA